ncbi:hypothetical protein ACVGWE_00540, partial [Enterobacter mori]
APAWYVLALSLMGLGLGIWLRQTRGCRARPAAPTQGTLFLNKR